MQKVVFESVEFRHHGREKRFVVERNERTVSVQGLVRGNRMGGHVAYLRCDLVSHLT